ncbi:hypothetical protein GCM10009547_04120 [Sporichthya brevicatena]|uniref:MSMEG_0570 family nitrogen starvation response protein n=1 Tax=Sporichthya brevicatena TaxID=171442 RepID=A0ABN1G710_9ACTN
MPEIFVRTSWPDGSQMRCYSPSLVIEEYLTAGTSYPVRDFVERSRQALILGSDRVRAKYGFGCGQAMTQLELIEIKAAGLSPEHASGAVVVDGFDR